MNRKKVLKNLMAAYTPHELPPLPPGDALIIPMSLRRDPVTAGELEVKLRNYGWTDDMFTPDMRACLADIAGGLNEMRDGCR